MIDKFDYEEPVCPLSCGKPAGTIPVSRIIEKADGFFDRNDYGEAGRLLTYWRGEARALGDARGELAMENELVGYYRKQNDKENGLASVRRALFLTEKLGQGENASGATVLLNCATAYKAFGRPSEAMELYRRAEKIYKRVLEPNDTRFGGLYNNMALALADLLREDEAERAYFAALAVMEKAPDGEAERAITYVNLAHMYEKFGKAEKISECMERAYALLKSQSVPHNGYYAFVLEKCAPSFGYFGNVEAYNEFKKESERIYAGN
ncbi:MAG: tetratricopeptide repeat protein [Ruminococcaceae bacterium]|nr:tetratricopeptide repeat protein [Oscillospiraceae bacterium]